MATKSDAPKPDAAAPALAPRSNKKLLIMGGVVGLVLALAGGGAWFFLSKNHASDGDVEAAAHVAPKGPPTFLPLENMVVNLADAGGEKVAQVGITLELSDAKAPEKVKMYLPSIRSGVLLLISQRTAEELLSIEGKEKLAAAILQEASRPFGGADADHAAKPVKDGVKSKKKNVDKKTNDENPVRGVHFSSFIIQ